MPVGNKSILFLLFRFILIIYFFIRKDFWVTFWDRKVKIINKNSSGIKIGLINNTAFIAVFQTVTKTFLTDINVSIGAVIQLK